MEQQTYISQVSIIHSKDSLSANLQNTCTLDIENGTRASVMPHEGMLFQSHEEAYNYYNNFGLTHEFAVRKYSMYKSRKDEVIVRRTFVCNREGFKKNKRL
ncbi:hypothetical protein DCAR_0727908 [Daucus carota subsp. sativus]|uniref:FAR1 domain-containing protein n=1 Tax=Daucus carota subsp. sativus TaxID=79200 RepID=A0AAF1B943_DAUCS|nr:hypothetical protein DCAR_0727908 [Daucus carota subsp. sativus]